MKTIVKWLVVAGLAYYGVTEVWPWVRTHLESTENFAASSAGTSDAERCLSVANRVVDSFGEGINTYARPGGDTGEWMRFSGQTQARIRDAQGACSGCGNACNRAQDAMTELEGVVFDFDAIVRRSGESFGNPATRLERVYDLLEEAQNVLSNTYN